MYFYIISITLAFGINYLDFKTLTSTYPRFYKNTFCFSKNAW